jgi:hypothetical protein
MQSIKDNFIYAKYSSDYLRNNSVNSKLMVMAFGILLEITL